jgi:aspartyl protease family protein
MIERALFIVTIVGGASLGVLWPLSKDDKVQTGAPAAIEVTLDRSSDKHFYTQAQVNGKSVRFLIDTGASEIALTEDDARKVGITVDPQKYELIGHGASGMVRGQYVELQQIDVGGIKDSGTKAVVVQGADVSLLGQPFLEKVDEIVIRKGEMVLKAAASS